MTNSEYFKNFIQNDLEDLDFRLYNFFLEKYYKDNDLQIQEIWPIVVSNRVIYINYLFKFLNYRKECNFYKVTEHKYTKMYTLEKNKCTNQDDDIKIIITRMTNETGIVQDSSIIYPYKFNNYGIRMCKIHIYRLLEWIN